MAQLTFYPVIGGSGFSLKSDAALATARANNASSVDTSGSVAINYLQSGNYVVYRIFLPFDTSAIGDGTITAATFSIKCVSLVAEHAISLVASTQASSTTLATTDHANFGTTKFCDTDVSDFTAGVFADYTLNAAGLAAISSSSYTNFAFICAADVAAGAVDGTNITFYGADDATPANRPKLVVTYTQPSGFLTFM